MSLPAVTTHSPARQTTLLAFEGIERPVALLDCGELADGIAAVLRGWRIREVAASPDSAPVITIRKTRQGYHRRSEWVSEPAVVRDEVDAVCELLPDLINSFIADTSSLLCLQGAGVALERGLVIIPSADRLVLTTIAVHLAAAGGRLFAADVLPLDSNNNAVAPGVLPRLRLPVPEAEGERFRDFVRRRRGPRGKDHLFVDLREQELAPFGTAAPICGVILLQRGPATRSELLPAREAEALKRMIPRSTARHFSALDRLDRLRAIVEGTRCFNLRYTTGEEAVRLLQDEFGPIADESAASRGPPWKDSPSMGTERLYSESHALVIGIAEYTGGWRWLRTPVRDAERVAEELRHRGFGVTLRRNLTGKAMRRELRKFFTQKGADPRAEQFTLDI